MALAALVSPKGAGENPEGPALCCHAAFLGRTRSPPFLQENTLRAWPCVSPRVSWKKGRFALTSAFHRLLSPWHSPAGITAASPHLFHTPLPFLFPFFFFSSIQISPNGFSPWTLSRLGSAWETDLSGEELQWPPGAWQHPAAARGSLCPGDESPSKLAWTMNQGICWCWETCACGTRMQFV